MAYKPKRRRLGPSWVGSLVALVAIVGYCLYTAARLRGAVGHRSTGGGGDRSLDVPRGAQQ